METGGATIKLVMTQMPVRIYLATRPLIDMAALILTAILTLTLLQIGVQFRVPVTAKQMVYRLTQHNGVTKMEMDLALLVMQPDDNDDDEYDEKKRRQ